MKSNFLKQMSKLLAFSIFASGLPFDLQAAKTKAPVVKKLGASPVPAAPVAGTASGATTPGTTTGTTPPPPAQTGTCPNGWTYSSSACKGYSGSSCNLNMCYSGGKALSANTPIFPNPSNIVADTSWSGKDTSPANDKIIQLNDVVTNLMTAIANYLTVSFDFNMKTLAYLSLKKIVLNYLMVSPCPATGGQDTPSLTCSPTTANGYTPNLPLPFSANLVVSKEVNPSGDFSPVISNTGEASLQKMALMWGFMQFYYASQSPCSATDVQNWVNGIGACPQMTFLAALVAVILYSVLATQPANFGSYSSATAIFSNQQWTQTCNNVTGACTSNPPPNRTPAEMVEFMNSPVLGGYKFKGGTIPTNILNLLIAVSTANWSAVSQEDLASVINNTDWAQFNSTMSAYTDDPYTAQLAQYMLGSFQAINNGNIYFRCDRDFLTGEPIDSSIYYAVNPQKATITLNDQYESDQQTMGNIPADNVMPLGMNGFSKVQSDFLPANVNTSFSYLTGQFYYWLPATSTQGDANNAIINGVVSLSGLNDVPGAAELGDMAPGSLWATACANNSSNSLPQVQSAILSLISEVGGMDTPAPAGNSTAGAPVFAGNTKQGAAQNLLVAAQAATNTDIVNLLGANNPYYSWVGASGGASLYPVAQPTEIDGDSTVYQGNNNGSGVIPYVLSNFDDKFATIDHLNMLNDLSQVLSAYASCWSNLSDCANQKSSAHQSGFDWVMSQPKYSTPISMALGLPLMIVFAVVSHYVMKNINAKAALKAAADANAQQAVNDASGLGDKAPLPLKGTRVTPSKAPASRQISGGGAGDAITPEAFQELKTASMDQQARVNQQLKTDGDIDANSENYRTTKANIQEALDAAEDNTAEAAQAEGQAQQWNDDFPDDPIAIDD